MQDYDCEAAVHMDKIYCKTSTVYTTTITDP